eukprot:225443-Chlamydomonas_euryale.AAC.1
MSSSGAGCCQSAQLHLRRTSLSSELHRGPPPALLTPPALFTPSAVFTPPCSDCATTRSGPIARFACPRESLCQVYYVYGFMLLVVVILMTVTACVTIVGTYFLLNAENYHWQVWKCGAAVCGRRGGSGDRATVCGR